MAETGRLSATTYAPTWVREHQVAALRIFIIVTVLMVWEAWSARHERGGPWGTAFARTRPLWIAAVVWAALALAPRGKNQSRNSDFSDS